MTTPIHIGMAVFISAGVVTTSTLNIVARNFEGMDSAAANMVSAEMSTAVTAGNFDPRRSSFYLRCRELQLTLELFLCEAAGR